MPSAPSDQLSDDARELGALGYAQELFRTMGGFSNFAISFSIISILTGAVTLYEHGLAMGGPAEMAFGWPLVSLFTLAVALSMAELASSLPTSGAMYHWASRLGGKGWGWFTAWFNIAGQLSALAGIDYGCALFVTPLLGCPTTREWLLLVYAAILLSHALINHFGIRLVAWLNDFSVTVHVVGVIAIVGALLLFAPKQPIGFFFARITSNTEGWPYWWAFVVGLLQAQWTFTGYDASASVSEETVDPRRRVPWGIVMAVVVSSVVGYLLLIALTLAIKDIRAVLNARDAPVVEVPAVIAILVGALGERVGSLFTALAAMAMWFCGLSAVTWSSRTIYAFARDDGLPGSALWRSVSARYLDSGARGLAVGADRRLRDPQRRRLCGRDVDQRDRPLFLVHHSRVSRLACERHCREAPRGPWHLGRFGVGRSISIAILWVIFIAVILSIPDNMRAGKTMLGLTLLLGVWYLGTRAPSVPRAGMGRRRTGRCRAWRERPRNLGRPIVSDVARGGRER